MIQQLLASMQAKAPLGTTEAEVGDRRWTISAVQNQDALAEAAEDTEEFPYGLLLWESAVGLSRMLVARPDLVRGKTVLELGAGVGLPGLVAQTLGAQVWQTDYHRDALRLAEINALRNQVSGVTRFTGDWRAWNHKTRYDVLLGADILYDREMQFHLETIFNHNLKPGGRLLLSDPGRPQSLEFVAHLEKNGWRIATETDMVLLYEEGPDSGSVEVALMIGESA